jgi:hypothetical protein
MRCTCIRPLNGRPRYSLNTVVDIDEGFYAKYKKYFDPCEKPKPEIDIDAIKAQLKEKGIEFDNRFGKAKLLELLNASEE